MSELTLRIQRDNEVVLPAAVLDGELSLPELGALVILAAVAEGYAGFDHPRMQDNEVQAAIKKLKDRGVFNVTVEGNSVHIGVELDNAMPPE